MPNKEPAYYTDLNGNKTEINFDTCAACGKPLDSNSGSFRDGYWYHMECVERSAKPRGQLEFENRMLQKEVQWLTELYKFAIHQADLWDEQRNRMYAEIDRLKAEIGG